MALVAAWNSGAGDRFGRFVWSCGRWFRITAGPGGVFPVAAIFAAAAASILATTSSIRLRRRSSDPGD
jgi:hypothetical protein